MKKPEHKKSPDHAASDSVPEGQNALPVPAPNGPTHKPSLAGAGLKAIILGEQLHISPAVHDLVEVVAPVKNRFVKPHGGFWTSSYIAGTSSWAQWCESEEFDTPYAGRWFRLTPDPAARVLAIDSLRGP